MTRAVSPRQEAHLEMPEGAPLLPLSRASSSIWRGVRLGSCMRSSTVIWPELTT